MENFEIRALARDVLRGQWGRNAAIIFFSGLINWIVVAVIINLTNFEVDSLADVITTFLIGTFITFAFTYAQYYVALAMIRGDRVEIGDLFVIFSKRYYVRLLIFSFITTLLEGLLAFIVSFVISFVFGFFGEIFSLIEIFDDSLLAITFFMLFLLVSIGLYVLIMAISGGVLQFAILTKIEYPNLPVLKAISYAWFLIKDRILQYILLNLSFFGWWLTCIFILPVLWVTPYYNTSMAGFYANAKYEKGGPEVI